MKKLVTVEEVSGEGLEALMGERVLLMCAAYFYTGVLVGVNSDFVKIEQPSIVYETGDWGLAQYASAQRLPVNEWYVVRSAIESFGKGK